VSPPGAGLGVGDGDGVGFGGIVPGTIVPVIAVAVTVPAGVIVTVSAVALGVGDESVAAPPHATTAARRRSAQTRIPLGTVSARQSSRFPCRRCRELAGEMLDRPVVGCNATDTERRQPGFTPNFGMTSTAVRIPRGAFTVR